jgi:hypothetical protein
MMKIGSKALSMSVEGLKSVFDVLTVVVLFLAFLFGAGVLITGNIINKRQAEQLRQFDKDVTEAKTELGKQQTRAAEADAKVAGLQTEATNAKAVQQRVEIDLAKQQQLTAKAERDLLELQTRFADRTISPAQQAAMIERLKPWAGTDIDIAIWGDTPEITIISSQILETIGKAQWSIHSGHVGAGSGAVRGIFVGVSPIAGTTAVTASQTLIVALQSAGLAAGPSSFTNMPQPSSMMMTSFTGKAPIRLFIGSKL